MGEDDKAKAWAAFIYLVHSPWCPGDHAVSGIEENPGFLHAKHVLQPSDPSFLVCIPWVCPVILQVCLSFSTPCLQSVIAVVRWK